MDAFHFSVRRRRVFGGPSSANGIMMPKRKATAFSANWGSVLSCKATRTMRSTHGPFGRQYWNPNHVIF